MTEISVTSSQFADGEPIPATAAHSAAGGDNVSPDLSWSGVPEGTKSIAVTCYDPDAPTTVGFSHWVLFDLDPSTTSLAAGAGAGGKNPKGSVLGFTDWGESQYGGMAPPPGDPPHHYHFTVRALDLESLGVDETTTYAKFNFVVRGHVLAEGTLTGLFSAGS